MAVGIAAALVCAAGVARAERVRIPSPYPEHPLFQDSDDSERACVLPPQEFDDRSLCNATLWPGGVVWYSCVPNVSGPSAARARIARSDSET
ncbi:MAG: hypothetical protein ACK58T_16325, partial [Phycisphaerae bacterium]